MRFGESLQRAIKAKVGASVVRELLENIQLTPQEVRNPASYRDRIQVKYDNAKEIDIVELWESLVGPVRSTCATPEAFERVQAMRQRAFGRAQLGVQLDEAEVMSNTFQMLTQAKLFTVMEARYQLVPTVFEELFGAFDSPYEKYNHVIPSDAPEVDHVSEGEDYGTAVLSDRYCETRAYKFGKIIDITRETMITDRVGQVIEQAEGLAESAKYRQDQLAARSFQDISNAGLVKQNEVDVGTYWPEKVNVPLYRYAVGTTKPAYESAINRVQANNLLHWDSISKAVILMNQMTNLKGQFIDVIQGQPLKLVVPIVLAERARMMAAPGVSTEIRAPFATDAALASAKATAFNVLHIPDFLRNMGVPFLRVIPWRLLTNAGTASESTWYLAGNSQKQFRRHRRWDTEFRRASQAELGGADFRRDVLVSFRAGWNVGFRCVDDKYVIVNTNA
jgi:hypothetical protein